MIKNLSKIVIVGGGSAGWMSAAMLIKMFPNWDISVVESPDYPTVGVGESTLQSIKEYCAVLEIDELDFMKHTDASYKLSIKFTDFSEIGDGGFHYPFGNAHLAGTKHGVFDWFIKKAVYPTTPNSDLVRSFFPHAALFETNKFSLNRNGKFGSFNPKYTAAYHFDATKFGAWLRDNYCIPRGVKLISSTVADITTTDKGVESLVLTDGTAIDSQLFIDCTGFKSLLLEGALKEEWLPYSDMLPNNRAWATRIPYKNKEEELEPYTNCTALGNGWVWNIPSWERIGTGYVYSDKFITPEDALEEFKQHLMSDKMKYPRTRQEVDTLEFNSIQFRTGIHRRIFVKNVVAIGLSAGFIEPLESNGLFSVHVFLDKLVKTLLAGTVNQWDRDVFNTACRGIYQNFAEFIALHYAVSNRDDTAYWQANADREYDPSMIDLTPTMSVGFYEFQDKKMFTKHLDTRVGITWISTGMNRHIVDLLDQKKEEFTDGVNHKEFYAPSFTAMEMNKAAWTKAALSELTLCEYLRRNIHTDQYLTTTMPGPPLPPSAVPPPVYQPPPPPPPVLFVPGSPLPDGLN